MLSAALCSWLGKALYHMGNCKVSTLVILREARTLLQLPFDLQEMPGWAPWQEELSLHLRLTPSQTTDRVVPGFFEYLRS